jgi:hypothetical protein
MSPFDFISFSKSFDFHLRNKKFSIKKFQLENLLIFFERKRILF